MNECQAKPFISRETIFIAGILVAFLFALFPRVFSAGEVIGAADLAFYYRPFQPNNSLGVTPGHYKLSDQFDEILPNAAYMISRLREGVLPAYTDVIQNGVPAFWVIRNPVKIIPLLGLALLFGFPIGWTLFALLQLLIGGVFFYRLLRLFEVTSFPAIIGTVTFCFSSYVIQNFGIVMVTQYFYAVIGVYAVERLLRHASRLWLFLFPLILQQIIVSGYPTTASYFLAFLGLYSFFRILQLREQIVKRLLLFFVLGLLALAMASPALLASMDFFSTYDWGYREAYWAHHVPRQQLITYFVPFFFGNPGIGSWIRECVYIGLIPLFFGLIGILGSWRAPIRIFFVLYFFWAFCVSYNLLWALQLYKHIPVFNSSMSNNQIIMLPFLASFLVAFGLNDVVKRRISAAVLSFSFLVFLAAVALVGATVFNDLERFQGSALLARHLSIQTVVLIGSALALFSLLRFPHNRFTQFFALGVLVCDLYAMGAGYNRSVPRQAFYPPTPATEFLKTHIGEHKLFLLEREFLANTPQYFGLPTVAGRGFFGARSKQMYRLIYPEAFRDGPTQTIFPLGSRTRLHSQYFDALGIRFVAAPAGVNPHELFTQQNIYKQKEWNEFLSLTAEKPIRQTFVASESLTGRKLEFIVASNKLEKESTLEIVLHSEVNSEDGVATLTLRPGQSGKFTIALTAFEFQADKQSSISFRLPAKTAGSLLFQWAKGVDIVKSGNVSLGEEALAGDLHFRLYNDQSPLSGYENKFQLAYDADLTIWENTSVFPRAWLTPAIKQMTDVDFQKAVLKEEVDLRQFAYVASEAFPTGANPLEENNSEFRGNTKAELLQDTRQRFRYQANQPAVMVVSDNFHNGWAAFVDGAQVPIFRVNLNMRGIMIPTGQGKVEFRYQPRFLIIGYWIAASAFVFLILWTVFLVARERARGEIPRTFPGRPVTTA